MAFIVLGLRSNWAGNLVVIKRKLFHLGFAGVPAAAVRLLMSCFWIAMDYGGADYKYSLVDFLLVPLGRKEALYF